MFSILTLFWALCFLCLINMIRFYSSTRALLSVLRDSDPLLYHAVGGNNAFTDPVAEAAAPYPLYQSAGISHSS